MRKWTARLRALDELDSVEPFEYPYMAAGKKRPDRMPKLLDAHRAAWLEHGSQILAGKSMGSRVGCHVANEPDVDVSGLICFGYPLRSPAGTMRDEVLLALETPILFIQGTRDRLCPLDLLEEVMAKMTAPTTLHIVDTGDHSLNITKTHTKQTGVTQADADDAMQAAIRVFLQRATR